MSKNYYVCSVGQSGKQYDDENLKRCLDNNCFVLNQYNKYKGAIGAIKIGDVLILKYKNHVIAYGRAISSLQTDKDLSNGEDWSWRIDINKWIVGNAVSNYGIGFETDGVVPFNTVKEVGEEFASRKMKEIVEP